MHSYLYMYLWNRRSHHHLYHVWHRVTYIFNSCQHQYSGLSPECTSMVQQNATFPSVTIKLFTLLIMAVLDWSVDTCAWVQLWTTTLNIASNGWASTAHMALFPWHERLHFEHCFNGVHSFNGMQGLASMVQSTKQGLRFVRPFFRAKSIWLAAFKHF